jgi:predicted aldo/keto reductase-like oxidoreductase
MGNRRGNYGVHEMKKRVLIDVKVVADVSKGIWSRSTIEEQAKQMESLASEFNDFVRDHRSMDWVTLYVEKEHQEQCSHCGYVWEVDAEGVPVCCDKAVDEHTQLLPSAWSGLAKP